MCFQSFSTHQTCDGAHGCPWNRHEVMFPRPSTGGGRQRRVWNSSLGRSTRWIKQNLISETAWTFEIWIFKFMKRDELWWTVGWRSKFWDNPFYPIYTWGPWVLSKKKNHPDILGCILRSNVAGKSTSSFDDFSPARNLHLVRGINRHQPSAILSPYHWGGYDSGDTLNETFMKDAPSIWSQNRKFIAMWVFLSSLWKDDAPMHHPLVILHSYQKLPLKFSK